MGAGNSSPISARSDETVLSASPRLWENCAKSGAVSSGAILNHRPETIDGPLPSLESPSFISDFRCTGEKLHTADIQLSFMIRGESSMSNIAQFAAYAAAFEKAYDSDD